MTALQIPNKTLVRLVAQEPVTINCVSRLWHCKMQFSRICTVQNLSPAGTESINESTTTHQCTRAACACSAAAASTSAVLLQLQSRHTVTLLQVRQPALQQLLSSSAGGCHPSVGQLPSQLGPLLLLLLSCSCYSCSSAGGYGSCSAVLQELQHMSTLRHDVRQLLLPGALHVAKHTAGGSHQTMDDWCRAERARDSMHAYISEQMWQTSTVPEI
jgi:hypothetical protein